MARRPQSVPPSASASGASSAASASPPPSGDREKIIAAFMALLAEHPFEELDFALVARRAGVSLERCRAQFGSLMAVLDAQMKEIDREVLAAIDPDMAEETARERLFDILMRRLEALAPHKAAIRSLVRSARTNPPLGLAMNAQAVRSQHWMLNAADISVAGLRGAIRAQGLACLYGDVLRTWLRDDDPGLARTMAALDRQLARGSRWAGRLDALCRLVPNPCRRRSRDRYADTIDPGEQPAVV